jgi:hypothetical protein
MSTHEELGKLAKSLAPKLQADGHKVEVKALVSDWKLALQYLEESLVGLVLIGLSESDVPKGLGRFLFFAAPQELEKHIASVEVGGNWIWTESSIPDLVLEDDKPFPEQELSVLLSNVNVHIGQKVIAVGLWEPMPHLAVEFSDGSVLVIHGDAGPYESWTFQTWGPGSRGVYALPGSRISVG